MIETELPFESETALPSAMEMLEAKWAEGKFLCVGLDVVADSESSLYEKAKLIVDATRDIAAAYKPNDAFYAGRGSQGVAELEELVKYVKELAPDVLVIWDAKRGDIDNTNGLYAKQRNHLEVDAMTMQPYLGGFTLEPLLNDPNKLGIVLAHTSNKEAGEFQELQLQTGEPLWERVIKNIRTDERWHHGSPLGIVMGATYPEHIARSRYLAGNDMVILVPGIGKQGGDLEKSVKGAINSRGNGFLINVSSGISKAETTRGKVTKASVRRAALSFHNQIADVWKEAKANPEPSYYEKMFLEFDLRLGRELLAEDCLKFGKFILKSELESPVYMDLRSSITNPKLRSNITNVYVDMLKLQEQARGSEFDYIAGNPQSATTYGALVADRMGRRLVQPRAGGAKNHGMGKTVEGNYEAGKTVHLIEDLITTAMSVMETAVQFKESGLVLAGVSALIDREQGGTEKLRFFNIPFTAASTLKRVVRALGEDGQISSSDYQKTMTYLG